MKDNSFSEFIELVSSRYSCRAYTDDTIEHKDIEDILNAARLAPSACNKQPWKFMVITSEENRNKIQQCYSREWIKNTPVFIVAMGNHAASWHRPDDDKDHTNVDLSIAIEHICLASAAKGLGTCWICNFDVKRFHELFSMEDGYEPIAIIPLGHPANESIPQKTRKQLNEIVIWD